ncbi:helix-turn-helix transcriptional regulator [Haploplasma axanthum]|uniref:HTH-type transcriptional regulator immR n=1 Tax=Haploplasma axanthum TaxID=29552 RepID=A0A449BGC2_HAPAX|nr:helix-turn-helix transcriptional regulator [Haploplasma axanthum]VEU79564.1 HTH-type transcriptional regulator immR [Haploplasma axanthum]VEU81351.1 HTH-type transcriptional regulator immR [Haploplasma axanthum]VEU81368.1 HTH-type transcriptional regulator immR [Haploplasma axanthum]
MAIKLNLKEFRQKKGLTQQELANRLKIDRTIISDYERSKINPSLERAIEMAVLLDVTVDELIQFEKIHKEYSEQLKNITKKKADF